jgi:AraC family transcriptional activator of pobA
MQPYKIKTISEYHHLLGITKPEHPMVSVISLEDFSPSAANQRVSVVFNFYIISLKRSLDGWIKYSYGQQQYDFDEGVLFFIAPNQVFSFEAHENMTASGWMLLIHPDLIWNTTLAKTIKQYGFFDYAANEALFISEKEEMTLSGVIQNIRQEFHANIDQFTQNLIIAQVETLLNYADRFYHRQFITRKITSHQVLEKLETLLNDYFNNGDLIDKGLPTVQYLADTLHISPTYLSTLLKVLTGMSAQQHIHEKLIEKAKERLSTTSLTISEVAYELGFEHPQSFSKLFKNKTNRSPLEFRASFN